MRVLVAVQDQRLRNEISETAEMFDFRIDIADDPEHLHQLLEGSLMGEAFDSIISDGFGDGWKTIIPFASENEIEVLFFPEPEFDRDSIENGNITWLERADANLAGTLAKELF